MGCAREEALAGEAVKKDAAVGLAREAVAESLQAREREPVSVDTTEICEAATEKAEAVCEAAEEVAEAVCEAAEEVAEAVCEAATEAIATK